jgi:DNA-binding MarR family transcriptional regulator
MGILRVLSENPGALLHEIVEKLAVPKSTLTNAVDRLARRGYVFRIISKKDRRSFELLPTDDGKAAQQQHIESEQAMYQKVADTLFPVFIPHSPM